MHLDDGQVQRLLDGELAPAAESSYRQHLAACSDCRGRVVEAERDAAEVDQLLGTLDHAPPPVTAQAVVTRARARDRNIGPLRWAAGIILAFGLAGAAYTAPGSPVRAWVRAVVERIANRPEPAPTVPEPVPAPDRGVAGIAVAPGRALIVDFTSFQTAGHAQVSLTDGAEVVVRAPAGAATFTSDVDRLVIDNQGATAGFEIQIPRSAPRIEIRVDGQRVLLKDGASVTGVEPANAQGQYVLPLTRAGS